MNHRCFRLLAIFLLLLHQLLVPASIVLAQEVVPEASSTPESTESPTPPSDPVDSPTPELPADTTENSQDSNSDETSSPTPEPSTEPSPSPEASTGDMSPSPSPSISPSPEANVDESSPSPSSSSSASINPSPDTSTTESSSPSSSSSESSSESDPEGQANRTSSNQEEENSPVSESTNQSLNPDLDESEADPLDSSVAAVTEAPMCSTPEDEADLPDQCVNTSLNDTQTGDALAKVDEVDIVQTEVDENSTLSIVTYDVTDPNLQVLDLTEVFAQLQAAAGACTDMTVEECESLINSGVLLNTANINVNLNVSANTGDNTQEGAENRLSTGDATALVNLIQIINSELKNSGVVIYVINILVPWEGDIWFPTPFAENSDGDGGGYLIGNNASLNNEIDVTANTGDNTQEGDENVMQTGMAYASVYSQQFINSYIQSLFLWSLLIHNQGMWEGSLENGESAGFQAGVTDDSGDSLNDGQGSVIGNQAEVDNNLTVSANTGKNSSIGNKNTMSTGNAIAIANLLQFVNTSIVDSQLFFGIINIIRPWKGNVWVGTPPVAITPTTPSENSGDSGHTSTDETQALGGGNTESSLPQVSLSFESGRQSVQGGETLNFIINLHNYSDTAVNQPVLEQVLKAEDGTTLTVLQYGLPTLSAGQKAKFAFSLQVPGGVLPGAYTSELILRDASRSLAQVSNNALAWFDITPSYMAQSLQMPSVPVVEVSTTSPLGEILGVQAAGSELPDSSSGFSWLVPSLFMFPILIVAFLVTRRLRRRFNH